jgi:hypothetical protein
VPCTTRNDPHDNKKAEATEHQMRWVTSAYSLASLPISGRAALYLVGRVRDFIIERGGRVEII